MSINHITTIPARNNYFAAWLLAAFLPNPQSGCLHIKTPQGMQVALRGKIFGPDVAMWIHRWRCMRRMWTGGHINFAKSFIDGDWSTPDLPLLLYWALTNEASLICAESLNPLTQLARRFAHRRRANTKHGSRHNIAMHYDIGNDFYKLWLDRGMNYSAALFTSPKQSLEEAQNAKLDLIIDLLDIHGSENILEIGFGWGNMLERLLTAHDCRATGLTLSTEQLAYTQTRLAARGVAAKTDLRLQDYRDVSGQFDRVVSIEMLEAVGERYWPVYFDKLRACLKRGGISVLQVITIAEDRFAAYRSNPDFIQSYIFPGGMLPTKTKIRDLAARAGLQLLDHRSFGESYARTLQEWRRKFLAATPELEVLGFDERFRRTWEYYLAYCTAGFLAGSIDVSLFKLCR